MVPLILKNFLPGTNSQVHAFDRLMLHWFLLITTPFSFLSFAPLLSSPCFLFLSCFLFLWFITRLSTIFIDIILILDFSDCFPQIKITGVVPWSREIVVEIHLNVNQLWLLYSWKFLPNSARSHWLLRGHMTSNNETVSCQNLWAGNIAKSITSEGSSALLPANVYRWSPLQRGFMNFQLQNFQLYNKSLKDWSHQKQDFLETKLTVSLGTSR